MLYIVQAKVKVLEESFEIRRLLYNNGFTIILMHKYTLERVKFKEDYQGEGDHYIPLHKNNYIYNCIYNSCGGFPGQEVFKELEINPSVESYKLEHRKDW